MRITAITNAISTKSVAKLGKIGSIGPRWRCRKLQPKDRPFLAFTMGLLLAYRRYGQSYSTSTKSSLPNPTAAKSKGEKLHTSSKVSSTIDVQLEPKKPLEFTIDTPATDTDSLTLYINDGVQHTVPGMKLKPEVKAFISLMIADLPSDIQYYYAWYRTTKIETVSMGLSLYTKKAPKMQADWKLVSPTLDYTPTQEDSRHELVFVVFGIPKSFLPNKRSIKFNLEANEILKLQQTSSLSSSTETPATKKQVYLKILGKRVYYVAPTVNPAPLRQMIPKRTEVEIELSPDYFHFTCMSWNLLAQRFIHDSVRNHCPDYALRWDYRKNLIINQNLLAYKSDLIGLQECEDDILDKFFKPALGNSGYDVLFERRGKGSVLHDGCAIFYKSNKFKPISSWRIDFNLIENHPTIRFELSHQGSNSLATDNVAITALFEFIQSKEMEQTHGKKYLWVVNSHLHWDPKVPIIKLLQADYMINRLKSIMDQSVQDKQVLPNMPVICMGDFNSTPTSSVYNYLTGIKTPLKDDIMNNLIGWTRTENNFKFINSHDSPELGKLATNITSGFTGCLDYIFHTPNMVTTQLLESPLTSENELLKQSVLGIDYSGLIPNPAYPSDHIPLVVKLAPCLHANPNSYL